eukprot:TRINITY_DN2419_c0_g1_i1.p1 TRINITY_DN2419_c0_g1~~TRINITY_DN2419_c0_g1_i1.p1  ORF type:complete len:1036 (-),score=207.05 TRINITY_DN2419_c0_g1_i1:100-3114(-)
MPPSPPLFPLSSSSSSSSPSSSYSWLLLLCFTILLQWSVCSGDDSIPRRYSLFQPEDNIGGAALTDTSMLVWATRKGDSSPTLKNIPLCAVAQEVRSGCQPPFDVLEEFGREDDFFVTSGLYSQASDTLFIAGTNSLYLFSHPNTWKQLTSLPLTGHLFPDFVFELPSRGLALSVVTDADLDVLYYTPLEPAEEGFTNTIKTLVLPDHESTITSVTVIGESFVCIAYGNSKIEMYKVLDGSNSTIAFELFSSITLVSFKEDGAEESPYATLMEYDEENANLIVVGATSSKSWLFALEFEQMYRYPTIRILFSMEEHIGDAPYRYMELSSGLNETPSFMTLYSKAGKSFIALLVAQTTDDAFKLYGLSADTLTFSQQEVVGSTAEDSVVQFVVDGESEYLYIVTGTELFAFDVAADGFIINSKQSTPPTPTPSSNPNSPAPEVPEPSPPSAVHHEACHGGMVLDLWAAELFTDIPPMSNCSWTFLSNPSIKSPFFQVVISRLYLNRLTDILSIYAGSTIDEHKLLYNSRTALGSIQDPMQDSWATWTQEDSIVIHMVTSKKTTRYQAIQLDIYNGFCSEKDGQQILNEAPFPYNPSLPLIASNYDLDTAGTIPYRPGTSCRWVKAFSSVKSSEYDSDPQLNLVFFLFDLGEGDQLEVVDGSGSHFTFTKDYPPIPLTSSTMFRSIEFTSNIDARVGLGFTADILWDTCLPNVSLRSSKGTLTDGTREEQQYGRSLTCSWVISPVEAEAEGGYVDISFNWISIGPGDFLSLYDGDSADSPLLETYTNVTIVLPDSLRSSSHTVFIEFSTTGESLEWGRSEPVTFFGFSLEYTACGSVCRSCEPGLYYDKENLHCRHCPENEVTSSYGEMQCRTCLPTERFVDGIACEACPEGTFIDPEDNTCKERTYTCKPGFIEPMNDTIADCVSCPKGLISVNQTACVACEEGFRNVRNSCSLIPTPQNNDAIIVYVLVGISCLAVGGGIFGYVQYRKRKQGADGFGMYESVPL